MLIKFLGTSSGETIPREGCDCSQCISTEKKDKRLRSSLLIDKRILIDASKDILKQLKTNQIGPLDSVFVTHEHRDHVAGLIDLQRQKRDLRIIKLKPGQHFKLLGIDFYAFKVKHSNIIQTVGVEIGPVVYIPDYSDLDWAVKYLKESKIAILDGSVLGRNFGGHLAVNETISQIKDFKNLKKIYFTHNGHTRKTHQEMQKLVRALGGPKFEIAFDGLELKI